MTILTKIKVLFKIFSCIDKISLRVNSQDQTLYFCFPAKLTIVEFEEFFPKEYKKFVEEKIFHKLKIQ